MTVGIAVVCESESGDPKVIMSSDRLLTTVQQSAIEHEHPETKLTEIGADLDETHLLSIIAGSVQLGENLKSGVETGIAQFVQANDEEPWVSTCAEIAGAEYRGLVQSKVEQIVLSSYGLTLEDLSRQHQFKDDFLNDILSESRQLIQEIHNNLVMLIGGVGPDGAAIYEVSNNNVFAHNDVGYATIGSGNQPAKSEFIKAEYSMRMSLQEALAVVAAANHRAEQASGVGGDTDIGVVTAGETNFVDTETVGALMARQTNIADAQAEERDRIIRENPVNWDP